MQCHTVIKSGQSSCNFGIEGLSWSEVGFFYFAGTWLLLLFGSNTVLTWQVLVLLNVVSLPYTFYSVYYQARIAKKWCVLCCTVQALLWLEFISVCLSLSKVEGTALLNPLSLNRAEANILICLLTPVLLWLVLKPLFLKLQQLQALKHQLRKFKYNAELFKNLLTAQPKYAVPDEEWSIVLGNLEASQSITMVTNPYCPPCAKTQNCWTIYCRKTAMCKPALFLPPAIPTMTLKPGKPDYLPCTAYTTVVRPGHCSIIQLVTPFLTQSIVDIGINTRNLNFIYIILIAQMALIIGRVSVEFIRSWILLHMSTRVNISILTDFLIKLMKLPMSFFDTKMTGDIMQRMCDGDTLLKNMA